MAQVIVFPNQASFENGFKFIEAVATSAAVVQPPEFCLGLVAPTIVVTGGPESLAEELKRGGVAISGVIPYHPYSREVPKAPRPAAKWTQVLGSLTVSAVRPSLTDPIRLRVDVVPQRSLASAIPFMARLIRGGSYRFEIPVLAFEEEHRLLAISANRVAVCRADDLLDAWVMLRSFVDLAISAWALRSKIEPEKERRQGIGAIEIFKRLPSTDCGRCGKQNCMEFASGLFTGKFKIDQCPPLMEERWRERLESVRWLMQAIGLDSEAGDLKNNHSE